MKTRKYNFLVIDMAGMTKREKWLFRLHFNYGVSVSELAETFQMGPADVRSILRRARRKYRLCSRWLGVR